MRNGRGIGSGVAVIAGAILLAGCLAVAAGAGAGAAIAWTNRGATAVVEGSVDDVFARSGAVFGDMGIARTGESSEESGAKRTITGTKDDLSVTVEMRRESATTTRVEVYASRSPVEWERDYARDVLNRIVRRE
jgi:hypothetical protein